MVWLVFILGNLVYFVDSGHEEVRQGLMHALNLRQVCKLLKHQVEGVAWLKSREKGKKRGGILADDMGLGKVRLSVDRPI